MYKIIFRLTVLAAIVSFAPAALAGHQCDEDDDIEDCVPYTRFVPRALPNVPLTAPKAIPRNLEKKAVEVEVPQPVARSTGAEVKVLEKPAQIHVPDVARVCKQYFPSLGKMLTIPCQ